MRGHAIPTRPTAVPFAVAYSGIYDLTQCSRLHWVDPENQLLLQRRKVPRQVQALPFEKLDNSCVSNKGSLGSRESTVYYGARIPLLKCVFCMCIAVLFEECEYSLQESKRIQKYESGGEDPAQGFPQHRRPRIMDTSTGGWSRCSRFIRGGRALAAKVESRCPIVLTRSTREKVRTSGEEVRTSGEILSAGKLVIRDNETSLRGIGKGVSTDPMALAPFVEVPHGSCVPSGKRCVPSGKKVRTSGEESAYLRGESCVPARIKVRTSGEILEVFYLQMGRIFYHAKASLVYVVLSCCMYCQQEGSLSVAPSGKLSVAHGEKAS